MGLDINEILIAPGNVRNLKCALCTRVLEDPTIIEPCEHMFCRSCITELQKLSTDSEPQSCPVDQKLIKDQKPASRTIRELASTLMFECGTCGFRCRKSRSDPEFVKHRKECRFNPLKRFGRPTCCRDCGGRIRHSGATHSCVKHLASSVRKLSKKIKNQQALIEKNEQRTKSDMKFMNYLLKANDASDEEMHEEEEDNSDGDDSDGGGSVDEDEGEKEDEKEEQEEAEDDEDGDSKEDPSKFILDPVYLKILRDRNWL